MVNLSVRQAVAANCIIEKLPDGSTAVFDTVTKTVHALDAEAAAVFEACREPKTISALADREGLTEEMAMEAVAELERAGLVTVSGAVGELGSGSRRNLLFAAGAALPFVLSLTAAEQRAFADVAASTIGAPASILSASTRFVANCGDNNITIVGQNTHFSGSSSITFNQPVSGVVLSVVNATQLTATFSTSATGGAILNFTITTGGEVVSGMGLLTVTNCPG